MRNFRIRVSGKIYQVEVDDTGKSPIDVIVNGRPFTVDVEWQGAPSEATVRPEIVPTQTPPSTGAAPARPLPQPPTPRVSEAERNTATTVDAPMPGIILEVRVKPGDSVNRGDELCVLEAMKMRNSIQAPRAGEIGDVFVAAGAKVAYGDPLVAFAQPWLSSAEAAMNTDLWTMLTAGLAALTLGNVADDGRRRLADLPGHRQAIRAGAADPHRGRRDPRQHTPDRDDGTRRLFRHSLLRRHRNRALPAADLHRHRRDDRLRPAAGESHVWCCWARPASSASSPRCCSRLALGFTLNEAASIGIIGAIDGPTSIYVSSQLAPHLLAPIAVAAYSYMSLVPIIQPPIMRALTTQQGTAGAHALHARGR